MIISSISRDTAILDNLVQTLSQIKVGGVPNKAIVFDQTDEFVSVDFYVDAARSQLLFSENTGDNPDSFSVSGTRTSYVPPDQRINFAPTVSDKYSQPLYYVTATFGDQSDAESSQKTYRNIDNLMFSEVAVSSKKNPEFSTAECIVVSSGQKTQNPPLSDDLQYIVLDFELNLSLPIFNWAKLSEQQRIAEAQNVNNLVRNALYADRYRDDNCTLVNADLNGTNVGQIQLLPSEALLRATIRVQCAFQASSTSY